MKGLIIKDVKLLKTQRTFLIIIVLFCILFLAKGQDIPYVFAYASAMSAMLVPMTITYDQMDNGMNFILTFPAGRKKYVLAKYVFGILMILCLLVVFSIVMLAETVARQPAHSLQDYVAGALSILLASVLIISVMVPVQLKFGAEKSRFALLILIGGAGLAVYAVREAAKAMHIDLEAQIAWILQAGLVETAVCLMAVAAGMLGISYLLSVAVMKKKQF